MKLTEAQINGLRIFQVRGMVLAYRGDDYNNLPCFVPDFFMVPRIGLSTFSALYRKGLTNYREIDTDIPFDLVFELTDAGEEAIAETHQVKTECPCCGKSGWSFSYDRRMRQSLGKANLDDLSDILTFMGVPNDEIQRAKERRD